MTCDAATISVIHEGSGSGLVTGGSISCGGICTDVVEAGGSLTLTFTPDSSGADLLGWGGQCAQYERRPSCTVSVNSANDRKFSGGYPVIFVTGFWADGVCRGTKPGGGMLYYKSLQEAWAGAQSSAITPRIECNSTFQQLVPTGSTNVTLSGGWGNFTPNTAPEPGAMTMIAGPIVLGPTTPTLIVGGDLASGNGGITIVGGYRELKAPVVITDTPMIIPDGSPYDLGVIIK